ncbi:MAG: type 1 repeat-containing [Trebouxia sp. A1-2]|nr:MAG: type 1 repeat-containing [Trebouxia sp. A1-2]
MRRARGMHSTPSPAGQLGLAAVVIAAIFVLPASAGTPHLDVAADLSGVLAKSLQFLRLNLNSIFGYSISPAPAPSRSLLDTNTTECLLPVWTCPSCINVPDSVYQTVLNTTCEAVTGLDLFVCGSSILDASVVTAVQSRQCVQTCAGSTPLQCPSSPATAPVPAVTAGVIATSRTSPAASPSSAVTSSPTTVTSSPATPITTNSSPASSLPTAAAPEANAGQSFSGAPAPLPASCNAGDATYACAYGGCTDYVSPDMYAYLNAANTTCITVLSQVICGCYAVDQSTYDAVTKGSCTLSCPQQSKICSSVATPSPAPATQPLFGPSLAPTQSPIPASPTPPAASPEPTPTVSAITGSGASPSSPTTPIPASPETNPALESTGVPPPSASASPYPLPETSSAALPPVTGPSLAPAIAPGACPASTCLRPQYQCGPMSEYSISLALHTAIDEATSCTPDLDPDFCIVDEFIVELPIWDAVKSNNCSYFPTAVPTSAPTLTPIPTPAPNASWAAPAPAAPSLTGLAPFVLNFGTYGDCSAECGGGNATRALTCVSQAYGLPVELSNCQYNMSTIANLTGKSSSFWYAKSCNTAPCGQYSFVVGPYGSCSALCGDSGTAERNVTCMHNGAAVDSTSAEYTQNCLPLGEPVSIEQCFATPCEAYMWETAAWGSCTGGMQNRTVSCQRIKGGSADAAVCTSQLGYTPLSSRLCNTFTCNTTADCSNNGVCNATTSACQCQAGYTGPNCAISTGLCNTTATASNSSAAGSNSTEICCSTGIVNSNGTCCTSGVVSDAGTCCALNTTAGANVTLDRAGQCCSQGLDACGVCGGNGLIIDFTGTCCNGALDASGLCCALPHVVDDFGVCAGNSSTGVIVLDLNVLSSNVTGLADANSSAHAAFATNYETLLASVLSVPAGQAQLESLQTGAASAPAPARRRLLVDSQAVESSKQAGTGDWSSRFRSFLVYSAQLTHLDSLLASTSQPASVVPQPVHMTPFLDISSSSSKQVPMSRSLLAASPYTVSTSAWISPPYADLTYPEVQDLIQAAYSNTTNAAGLALQQLTSVSKQGVAGNGLCENGEMPSSVGNFTGVPSDCPITFHPIPTSSGTSPCSGHGAPVAAQGICQCYVGYDGTSCGVCADGYQLAGGICQRTLISFKAQAALAAIAQSNAASTQKAAGASVGMIAGAVIAGVAAMLVALALFTTYRRRRLHRRHVYMGAKGARGRTSGAFTAASSQGSQSSSGLSGGMAWAFQDPEHGSTTSKASETSLSGQQRSNFKMVVVNNKPMHSWYNWLTAAGVTEDQVEIRRLGDGERDTERGPASPPPAKKPSLLKRAYDLTVGNPADSTVSSVPSNRQVPLGFLGSSLAESDNRKRRGGAGTAFTIMEPQYSDMDHQNAEKKARRGSLAFSNGSDASSDASSAARAGRGAYGLTMGEGGSGGIGRGGQSARRGGTALFEGAPSEAGDSRRAGKSNIYGTMAFSDMEKENEGGLMKRISKGWRRGSSSRGTASTVTSSGGDSRGSARSGGMASIAFTGSSGGRSRHHNLLMETNMAFENGSDGGRTKRSHGTGFFAFSQAAEEEEERRSNRPNFALSEDLNAAQPTPAPAGARTRRAPLKELGRTESVLSTQSTRRNYAYSLEAAPDAHPTRKHLNTFSAIDATDDSEEPGSSHVKTMSRASLATSTTGSDQSAAQLLRG